MSAPDFAGVLAAHAESYPDGCLCEGYETTHRDVFDHRDEHRAHVAAALDAELVAWLSSEAAVGVVSAALIAEGAASGNSLHSWRCVYEECDCVPETARAALAALAQAGGGDDE